MVRAYFSLVCGVAAAHESELSVVELADRTGGNDTGGSSLSGQREYPRGARVYATACPQLVRSVAIWMSALGESIGG